MTIKVTPHVLQDTVVTAGNYGGPSTIPTFTVDQQGRLTGASNASISLTKSDITTFLGYGPYPNTNPSGWTTNTGTVTSVGGTGTVSGISLSGTVTGSGSLTLGGTLSLTSSQVTTALGFTPYNSTNPSSFITGINSTAVTNALGYTPYNSTNPSGYQTASGSVDYADRARFASVAATQSTGSNDTSIATTAFVKSVSSSFTGWRVTYVDESYAKTSTITIPTGCIGIYVYATVSGGGNNGGTAKAYIKNSSGTIIGTMSVNGTNVTAGVDGGSGMIDGAGSFIPLSSNASYVYFDIVNNSVAGTFYVQSYVYSS